MESHRKIHKDISEINNYKCSECNYVTKYLNGIKRHMRRHERLQNNPQARNQLHKCKFCTFQTLDWRTYNIHIKSHTNLEPIDFLHFKCEQCDYATNKKFFFNLHLQKHDPNKNEGKRKCPKCNYWTRFKNHLKRHVAGYHVINVDAKDVINK